MTKVGDVDWNDLLANEAPSTRANGSNDSSPKFRSLNEPDFVPVPSTANPAKPLSASELELPKKERALRRNESAKGRQVLILAAIGVTGSLVAIGCFVLFVQMVGNKPQPIAKGADGVDKELKTNVPTPSPSEPSNSEPIVPPVQEPGITPPIDPSIQVESEATGAPATIPLKADDESTKSSAPTMPTEPTQSNPSAPQTTPDTTSPSVASDDESIAIPPVFGILRDVLQPSNAGTAIIEPSSERTELNIENAPVDQKQVFHPDPKPIPAWAERSSLTLSSFRQKNISLLRCIDLFGRMTGVGITVDWQSCRVANIDLTKSIEIDEKDKTIAELVSEVIRANGLEWNLDANGLPVVSAPKAAMEAKSTRDWSTKGLFQSNEREACETLIRLWEYQDVCSYADEQLRWSELATPIQKANMKATLCELATLQKLDSNLWSKSPEFPLIFSLNHWKQSIVALERKTRLTLEAHERRPIPDLLMTTAAETQLDLIIDWQNAWQHGLTPTNSAAIVLGGRTFPQTAKRFLTDYALEIVPILDDTVLLTTREVRRSLIRTVPLRMPKNTKLDDLRQYLRTLAPLVNNRNKFKIVPIPGTDDLYFARICSPSLEQLNDQDVVLGLGWPERP